MRPDDEELDAEIRGHMALSIRERIARGDDPKSAQLAAQKDFGNVALTRDAMRSVWSNRWRDFGETAARDVRFALRSLHRAKGLVATVVLTLGLGLGASTAIFTVVRGVLLKPLPHRDSQRLLYLRQSGTGPGQSNIQFSVPEINDLRAGTRSISGIAGYSPWALTLQGDHDAARINVAIVTGNYFAVMGLSAIRGRLTRPSDDGPGVEPVLVLTHAFWLKQFGGDSSILGKQLRLDGTSVRVIGILEPAPFFPDRVDVLANQVLSKHHLSAEMVQGRSHRMTEIVARVAPGASVKEAKTEIDAVYARIQSQFREAYDPAAHYRITVMSFEEALTEPARLTLWLLMGAAGFVLIISVANVANLTLMRGVRREHELVVRAALGAGVSRLRRLLLVENLVLTCLGAALGLGIALGGVQLLVSLAERYSPRASEIRLDVVAFGFTLALAIVVALALSFISWLPPKGNFAAWIVSGVRMAGSVRKQRLQRGLVVTQIAVSVVLLAGAGLLIRTTMRLTEVDSGLRTVEVLTIQVPLLAFGDGDFTRIVRADVAAQQAYDRMRREIRALPGVVEVALGSTVPLRSSGLQFEVKAEGKSLAPNEVTPRAELRTASPEYFRASGIPLLKGREFFLTDRRGSEKVVIINQRLADRLFPGENPIGKRVAWRPSLTGDVLKYSPISPEWRTVVGVVASTRDGGLDAEPRAEMFQPFAQELALGGGLVIRADSNVENLVSAATRIVQRIAPGAPMDVLTVAQIKDQSVSPRRFNALLLSAFGVLALIIAAVGIASVLAFSVSARTNEIGIRMSLGADRGRVQRMVLREGGVLVAGGLLVGVIGAFLTTSLIRGLLFDIPPHDPTTFAAVALTMAAIGILACWIPALNAARIDPLISMRS